MIKKLVMSVFAFILLIQIVYAINLNLVPKLELCTEQRCYSSIDKISLEPEVPIILELSIINDQGIWLCWDAMEYKFNLNSETVKDGKIIIQKWITKEMGEEPSFCLSPNKKYENVFFIPLKEYNSLEKDKQRAKWSVTEFYLYFENLKCYTNIKLEKQICSSWDTSNNFKGNNLEFDVRVEGPTKGLDFWGIFTPLFIILSFLDLAVLGFSFAEMIKDKERRILWILLFIVSIVFGYFLVKWGFLK